MQALMSDSSQKGAEMHKRSLFRLGALIVLFAGTATAQPAQAAPNLVVDMKSGRVLHHEQATRPWYPASLTKMMTAYVALEAVRNKRLQMQTPLRVSARAAQTPPSKMGFKPGVEVTLENALKIIMVRSANDVSVTIAEGISGSVDAFAAEMNATARRLGMRQTNFVNPHGLPNSANVSSARDLAILARALLLDFPDSAHLFGIGAIRFGKAVMRNHNGAIGRYPGANGLKTGFICASGFNVVATATRYGRTVIVVVLGAPNPQLRTLHSMALLDVGFSATTFGRSYDLQSLPRSPHTAPPDMRSQICNRERRREMVEQYAAANLAAALASPRVSAPGGDAQDNPAAFFAADRARSFAAGGQIDVAKLELPPQAKTEPVTVYTGRSAGWSGDAVGPGAPATGTTTADAAPPPAAAPAPAVPIRLQGASTQHRGSGPPMPPRRPFPR